VAKITTKDWTKYEEEPTIERIRRKPKLVGERIREKEIGQLERNSNR